MLPILNPVNSNRARDHLANERTFLAWLRTSVALMGFGVLIVRLEYLMPRPRQFSPRVAPALHAAHLGVAFAVIGLLMMPFALHEYNRVSRSIDQDVFEPQNRIIALFALAVMLLGGVVIAYLLLLPPPVSPVALAP